MKNAFVQHFKKLGAGLILAGAAFTAHAEYYIVYPASTVYYQSSCGSCGCKRTCYYTTCCRCKQSCHQRYVNTNVEYIYSHAPRARNGMGTGEIAPYAWIPYPEAP
jgi:hypothetical protein